MAVNKLIPIPSDLFDWDRETAQFTAEISTIQGYFPKFSVHQRIYNDACDVGFAMQSIKTGEIVVFFLERADTHDGEIQAWRYQVIREHCFKHPKLRFVSAIIFND